MKTAIITGSSGMDGNILCKKLLAKRYRVIGIDRKNIWMENKNYFFEEGDISDDNFIYSIIYKYKPDYFYNLAAGFPPKSFDIPVEVIKVNTIAVINMLEMIRKYSPKTRFYQASSSEMIGKGTGNSLNSKMLPTTPYSVSKLASHHIVRIYREKYGLFAVSGMCWNHEGSDRADYFVTKKISNYVSKGDYSTPLEIGNLDSSRDWGFADEYVDAMILMMEARAPDDYEVNTGEAHTIREFIEEAFRCVEKRVTWIGTGLGEKGVDNGGYLLVKVNKEFYRPSVPHLPGNHDKIKKKLGWAPKVKFKKLVKIMVDSDIKEGD